ncbi:LysR family transcriptional regulator [Actinoplanes sp. LDG1-06]|uniref:LysR family transcriptional regulator n=1 Tax=Paractinoplanes ovalisporus TaxID=2810368 RepID=A0ABS2ALX7_9ACTN|nr:LysR family transcriptional regulator [Actinoplanes ovalisporus]MBM2620844.1 LysR family transcriptional regulator [Actinoplanes ovalisporus]
MELRQLELFVAVAEAGVFARAAERCDIAPSALSATIRSLERDLGAQLFERTTRKVELTEAGRALLPQAREVLTTARAARATVDAAGCGLTVGGIPTTGLLDQPALLQRFVTRFPEVEVRYRRETSDRLLDELRQRRLDLAIVSLPAVPPDDLSWQTLAAGPLLLACRDDHPLAGRRAVTCRDLAGERFVAAQPGSRGHDYLRHISAAACEATTVAHHVHDVPTMLDFVERGLGVALAVDGMLGDRPGLRGVPIADSALTWTLAAVTPPVATPAARRLLAMLG